MQSRTGAAQRRSRDVRRWELSVAYVDGRVSLRVRDHILEPILFSAHMRAARRRGDGAPLGIYIAGPTPTRMRAHRIQYPSTKWNRVWVCGWKELAELVDTRQEI